MGITIMVLTCSLMVTMMSPIKVAFTVTVGSIMVAVNSYIHTSAMFPSCSVVLSFSSGMMVMFCYCAMMTNYESKQMNHKATFMMMTMATPYFVSMSENQSFSNNLKTLENLNTNTTLWVAMGVIILAMVCINKSMFTPTKNLVGSY